MSHRSNAAEAWYQETEPSVVLPGTPLDLLPPDSLTRPLWKSLVGNLRDTLAPEKLLPLERTSRPVDVGLLLGDRLSLPWFRTVFTNLGDVISPETLPPLELESRPIDVGELITDQLSHFWWSSLLRSLADRVAPERQAALLLTSKPIMDVVPKSWLLLPLWSEVISTPKVFYPDKPKTDDSGVRPVVVKPQASPVDRQEVRVLDPTEADVRRDLRRSKMRQRIWITMAAAQVAYLLVIVFWR